MKLLFSALIAAAPVWMLAAGGNSRTVSYTQYAKRAKLQPPVAYPEQPVEYQGFSVRLPAKSKWGVINGAQRPNQAMWAVIKPADIHHSTLATIKLSPPMPEKYRKDLTAAKFREALEKTMKKNPQNRMKEMKVRSKSAAINGLKGIMLTASALDCGGKYASPDKPFALYIHSFNAVTPDGRIFSVSVSERIPAAAAKADTALAEEFINAVTLQKK